MIVTETAHLIVSYALFLRNTDEGVIKPDVAVREMKRLQCLIEGLGKDFIRQLIAAFAEIAPGYYADEEIVRNLARDYHLEETVAADDPVRLAELKAQRDAEG